MQIRDVPAATLRYGDGVSVMSTLPTIIDVARVAGVSRQTVSNALNSPELVRPETLERVRRAVETLGYRPHASARRLRTKKSSTIAVRLDPVLDGISGAVLDRFLHALTQQADGLGLRILVFTAATPEDEIRQFTRLSDGRDADAFVITSTFHGDPRTAWLLDRARPFVMFGRPWGASDPQSLSCPWVDVDGREGVRTATAELLGRGLRRIGFLGWPSGSGTGDERAAGWADAMTAAGLGDGLAALRETATDEVASARSAARRLFERMPGLEAVVTASDSLALGTVLHLHGRLPVTGFDNTPVSAAMGFSSVDQRLDHVADAALAFITGTPPSGARHRLITPELIVRR